MAGIIEQRAFAGTDRSVGVLGLGTVKFGRNTGVKYPGGDGFALPDDRTVNDILDLCLAHGVNLLDTAPAYGVAEERLGSLLGARRDKFFLVTKIGEEFDGSASRYDFSAAHTVMSVERSLKRLKTDRLDCVLLHCPRDDLTVIEDSGAIDTLIKLKSAGKVLSFGASVNSLAGGLRAAQICDAVMVSYNSGYTAEHATIEAAAKNKAAVLIKKALSSGHTQNAAGDLRFAAQAQGVTSLVIGSTNPANIMANILALPAG